MTATGTGMADIHDRLYNWARWSRHEAMPDLGCKPPPIFAYWIPAQAWDAGYGDTGAPEELPKSIDVRDAELLDHHIVWLALVHRTTIKRHYLEHIRQMRDQLDEACRALEDLMR